MLPHENPHHLCYFRMPVCVRITAISIMAYFENVFMEQKVVFDAEGCEHILTQCV